MPENTNSNEKEVGFATSVHDYLLYVEGLPSSRVNDILLRGSGGRAIVTSLSDQKIEALMLDPQKPKPGDMFSVAKGGLKVPISAKLFGRAINPLGVPIDGKGGFPEEKSSLELDVVAPGIDSREIITDQLITGFTTVDTLLPIGKGQRELLFGEPRSGRTEFLQDIIVNQKGNNMICVYAAIGKADIDVKRFVREINEEGAGEYTIIIAATSSDVAPLIAIAPAVALSIAEYHAYKGSDVILILDDLGTHAKYLREIGLLSGQIPGRESYPADIFYQHSHLVERAGRFSKKYGGATITLLPVIETDVENFTNLIPTNVMSMTDGHILFSASMNAQGHYPPIRSEISVTRVGHQTQKPLLKVLSDKIRSLIAEYQEFERYGRFGSELTPQTQIIIKKGQVVTELLKQEQGQRVEFLIQIMMLCLVFTTFFEKKDPEGVKKEKPSIIRGLATLPKFIEIQEAMLRDGLKSSYMETLIQQLEQNIAVLEDFCQKEMKQEKTA